MSWLRSVGHGHVVPKVEEAMQPYQVCKERLDKVKETLANYLQPETADGSPPADDDQNILT
jgi:hypothetical protein